MNPAPSQNSKWAEIRQHGLFGRQLIPVFKPQYHKWVALVGLSLIGITFYWKFTYSGPYRYLAELQLKWFESYDPSLTCLLVFSGLFIGLLFGLLGIAVAIKLLFRGAERPVPGMPSAPIESPGLNFQMIKRWELYVGSAGLVAAPLVFFGMGAYIYYNAMQAGSLKRLSAADFQSGKMHARVVYADVHGFLSKRYINADYYYYIPMTSTAAMTGPVHLVAGIPENEMSKYVHREADGTLSVRGMADKGLEGDVKYAFEKIGITVGEPVWVVHAGHDPSGDRKFGLFTMGLGFPVAVLFYGVGKYWKRKRSASKAAQATA